MASAEDVSTQAVDSKALYLYDASVFIDVDVL
jgi:hypothetical protein